VTLLAKAQGLSDLIGAEAPRSEADATLSPLVVEAFHEAGLFGLMVPKELGGQEADLPTVLEVYEAVSRADGSAGWTLLANATTSAFAGAYTGPTAIAAMFQMNPEKSRVQVGTEFALLAETAVSADGTTIHSYLEIAQEVYRSSQSRPLTRVPMIHPGSGLPSRVKAAIGDEIPAIRGEELIEIRWGVIEDDTFFDVDLGNRILWLNKDYRKVLLGGKRGGLNDAPLLKSMLYLLAGRVFEGEYLGRRERDNLEIWQAVLTAAAQAERR